MAHSYFAATLISIAVISQSFSAFANQKIELTEGELKELIHQFYEATAASAVKNIEIQRLKSKKPEAKYWVEVARQNRYDRKSGTMRYWTDAEEWQEYSDYRVNSSRCVELPTNVVECQLLTTYQRKVSILGRVVTDEPDHRLSFRAVKEASGYKLIAYQLHLYKGWCALITTSQSDCDG